MLGSCETGLDLLTDANSLFLFLLAFARCLVLVAIVSSTLKDGGSYYFQRVVYNLSTENSLRDAQSPWEDGVCWAASARGAPGGTPATCTSRLLSE